MRSVSSYFYVCLGVVATWVMYGASCPQPRNPVFFEVIPDTDTGVDVPLPACIDGFVCINFRNASTIPVRMALYRHNGFEVPDEIRRLSTECCVGISLSPCPCDCPGEDQGNCLLTNEQIFNNVNLDTIAGAPDVSLAPNATVLKRIRCNQVKTIGVALSDIEEDPTTNADDQLGPAYREEPGAPGGVASVSCGGTIQFSAEDFNEADEDNPELALVILTVQTSR